MYAKRLSSIYKKERAKKELGEKVFNIVRKK